MTPRPRASGQGVDRRPLGVCFLPAFICLGVVPVVAGLACDAFPPACCEWQRASAPPTRKKCHTERGNQLLQKAIRLIRQKLTVVVTDDTGMSTVEYAIGTVAAAAFGAILYTVVTGDSIVTALSGIIARAPEHQRLSGEAGFGTVEAAPAAAALVVVLGCAAGPAAISAQIRCGRRPGGGAAGGPWRRAGVVRRARVPGPRQRRPAGAPGR